MNWGSATPGGSHVKDQLTAGLLQCTNELIEVASIDLFKDKWEIDPFWLFRLNFAEIHAMTWTEYKPDRQPSPPAFSSLHPALPSLGQGRPCPVQMSPRWTRFPSSLDLSSCWVLQARCWAAQASLAQILRDFLWQGRHRRPESASQLWAPGQSICSAGVKRPCAASVKLGNNAATKQTSWGMGKHFDTYSGVMLMALKFKLHCICPQRFLQLLHIWLHLSRNRTQKKC